MGVFNRRPGSLTEIVVPSAGLTTATTAYTSGDMVGTMQTIAIGAGSGFIRSAMCIDPSDVLVATGIELWLFNASVTQAADNAANSWSDADMANLTAIVPMTLIFNGALNTVVTTVADFAPMPFVSSGNLYMCVVTRGANAVFAAGATSLTYKLRITST